MKTCLQFFTPVVLSVFLLANFNIFALAQESSPAPDNSWLNGQWAGIPPAGGELRMNLKVNGNKIEGDGVIQSGPRGGAYPTITGTVNGNKIVLETYFPEAPGTGKRTVRYRCVHKEEALQCQVGRKFQTTFSKIK